MANLNFTGHIDREESTDNPFNESSLYGSVYKSIVPKVKKRLKTYKMDNIHRRKMCAWKWHRRMPMFWIERTWKIGKISVCLLVLKNVVLIFSQWFNLSSYVDLDQSVSKIKRLKVSVRCRHAQTIKLTKQENISATFLHYPMMHKQTASRDVRLSGSVVTEWRDCIHFLLGSSVIFQTVTNIQKLVREI